MKTILKVSFIVSVCGLLGLFIGAGLNAEGYVGNIIAIAVSAGFVVKAIEGNKK